VPHIPPPARLVSLAKNGDVDISQFIDLGADSQRKVYG
jgi:hypothetical protein